MSLAPSLTQIKRVIESMKSDSFPAPQALDLFQEIYKLQLGAQNKLSYGSIYKPLLEDLKPKKVRKVEDFLTLEKIAVDWTELRKLLGKMLRAAADISTGDQAAAWKKIAAKKELEKLDLKALAKAALQGKSPELELPVPMDMDALLYLAFSAVQPWFRVCARGLEGQKDLNDWHQGYCPVCGQEPVMALLQPETGKRILCCRLCDTQWPYPRLQCPFCENENIDKLGALFFDDNTAAATDSKPAAVSNDPFVIDYCRECKRYLKAYDLRKPGVLSDPFPPLLDIMSLELDALAEERGLVPEPH